MSAAKLDEAARITFGTNLKMLRLQRSLSQQQLGDLAGISRNVIGQYERGGISPTLETLSRLSRSLGVTPAIFFDPGEIDEPQPVHYVELPLFESIPDGTWDNAIDSSTETYPVLRPWATAMRVVVRAMSEAMFPSIWKDDLLLVDASRSRAKAREIVIARFNSSWTMRRFSRVSRQLIFDADNPSVPPTILDKWDDVEILGVVLSIVRRDLSKIV